MVPFFPVLGWQGAEDWKGCAMGEGAEPQEHLHLLTLQSSVLLGSSFVENLGIFRCFLVSPLCQVQEMHPNEAKICFFWDQRHPVLLQNLPCRVMTRSGLFLKLLLLSCVVCPFGNEEQRQSNPLKGRTKGSAAPSPSFPRIKHCSGP